ncbi:hypothetical protein [Streptomyces sp. NBC_01358]|uniref:hypothetical protein n=1 Tax=Streptomyces sp. NBC_01358 TaxID=2903837 RepID=UPI002E35CE48|nr:hypothetical protein [Streptomyces sp. NBC_01358]
MLTRRKSVHKGVMTALAAALLGAAVLAPEASAVPATDAVSLHSSSAVRTGTGDVLDIDSPDLVPEGVTWDPTRNTFLVSSARKGTVSIVTPQGTTRPLVTDPRLVSTYGVHVDAAHQRVLVAYADPGAAESSAPGTTNRISGIGVFDLRTGEPIRLVDLTHLNPGRSNYFVNDFAVAPDGTAYVADVFAPEIYKVTPDGRTSVLARDAGFAGEDDRPGLNGVVWHPSGYLLAVNDSTGSLYRVSPRDGHVRSVRLERPLLGGDGLSIHGDGDLAVVTNTMATPKGREAVTVLHSNSDWCGATTVRTVAPWASSEPTTSVGTPYGTYVISGGVGTLFSGGAPADTFTLRRLLP